MHALVVVWNKIFHSLNLAKSAQVTRIRKDDWSRAGPVDPGCKGNRNVTNTKFSKYMGYRYFGPFFSTMCIRLLYIKLYCSKYPLSNCRLQAATAGCTLPGSPAATGGPRLHRSVPLHVNSKFASRNFAKPNRTVLVYILCETI